MSLENGSLDHTEKLNNNNNNNNNDNDHNDAI